MKLSWCIVHESCIMIYILQKRFFYNSYYFNRWISMGGNLVRWSSIGWLTFIRMGLLFERSPEIFVYFFIYFISWFIHFFLLSINIWIFLQNIGEGCLYDREHGGKDASSTDSNRIEAKVFSQLMGAERYGWVRGYGIGIIPTQLSAVSRFTQESRDGSTDVRVHRLEDEIA